MKRRVQVTAMIFSLVDDTLCLMVSNKNQGGLQLPSFDLVKDHGGAELIISEFLKKTKLGKGYAEQLYTFIEEDLIQIGYIVLLKPIDSSSYSDQIDWKWTSIKKIPKLQKAYMPLKDVSLQRLKNKIAYSRVAVRMLKDEFTLNDLQHVYEQILGEALDKRNFRKKVENKKIVKPLNKFRRGSHRPARLYKIGPKSKNVPL